MASISKRASGAWQNTSYGIRATATDTITTLPTIIYGDGTNATISIKGNTVQSDTPTPENPVMPQGCGELETVGAKAGQYKIPISSADTTTPVYLGEVESTRQIRELVLTGDEAWSEVAAGLYRITINGYLRIIDIQVGMSSHFGGGYTVGAAPSAERDVLSFLVSSSGNNYVYLSSSQYLTMAEFKTYLQQQYAAGTPVCVWYILAEPTTGIVNEPLMRIGDYADEVSGISIPTTDGANTLSVDTTVQPSEVSINYHGWHMGTVHERTAGQWD